MLPDYLVIGHITRDISNGKVTTGGCAYYGAVTARKLGISAAMVTSCPNDFGFPKDLEGVEITTIPSRDVTAFINDYVTRNGSFNRTQTIISTAKNITISKYWISCLYLIKVMSFFWFVKNFLSP